MGAGEYNGGFIGWEGRMELWGTRMNAAMAKSVIDMLYNIDSDLSKRKGDVIEE